LFQLFVAFKMDFDRNVLLSLDGCSFLNSWAEEFSLCISGPALAAQPQFVDVKGAKSTRFLFAFDEVAL
jgi:hypothetical protein